MLVGKSLLLIWRISELFWTSSEIIGCLRIYWDHLRKIVALAASHEDENVDKLTPLQCLNVKLKHSVFSLKNDVWWTIKLEGSTLCKVPTSTECFAEITRWESSAAAVLDWYQEASNKLGFYWHKSYRTHISASASSLCSLTSSSSSSSSPS